jgi:cytochrome c-type biogenesis protein CcmH/NrfF
MTRRLRVRAVVLAVSITALALPSGSALAAPRASLTDIENDVICVVCHEPLAVSQSPEADRERNFIRGLISQGQTKPQIERQLVAQYGVAVLGKPPAHGFNLTVYVLPAAIVLLGLATLALTLPRWRRRTRDAPPLRATAGTAHDSAEQRRLDEELSHFGG